MPLISKSSEPGMATAVARPPEGWMIPVLVTVNDQRWHLQSSEVYPPVAFVEDRRQLAARVVARSATHRPAYGNSNILVVLGRTALRVDPAERGNQTLHRVDRGRADELDQHPFGHGAGTTIPWPTHDRDKGPVRAACRIATSCAIREPSDTPTTCAPPGATCSINPAVSSAMSPRLYVSRARRRRNPSGETAGPITREERPTSRLSKRTTRSPRPASSAQKPSRQHIKLQAQPHDQDDGVVCIGLADHLITQ